jgi:hypothetical protein
MGAYLDMLIVRRARNRASSSLKTQIIANGTSSSISGNFPQSGQRVSLPITDLKLAGFVCCVQPFFSSEFQSLKRVEFLYGCIDAGIALPTSTQVREVLSPGKIMKIDAKQKRFIQTGKPATELMALPYPKITDLLMIEKNRILHERSRSDSVAPPSI